MTQFVSSKFHYTFGPHEPTLRVAPGTSLCVVCPDSDNELADGSVLSAAQREARRGPELLSANPMAGPIYVEGAAPGDAIAVDIHAIDLDREKGQSLLAWGHGLLPPHLLLDRAEQASGIPEQLYLWKIDTRAGTAELANPLGPHRIVVKLDPFIGCIGTCPKWGQFTSTLYSGDHGGNMDLPAIRPGATLCLPVQCEGGLLMMGDIHAAQGDGEIIGGGIETSGKIHCTIRLVKGMTIASPRLRDAKQIAAIAVEGELRAGVQRAYSQLVMWLSRELGMNRWDAYHLVSQTGSARFGGLGPPPNAVSAGVPLKALPTEILRRIEQTT